MITYNCPKCAFCFNQSDSAWDVAVMSGNCPKCNSALVNFAVPTNTQVSEKFKHSKQNLSPSATDKAVLGGVLLAALGAFILFHTFDLFFQDQAVLFLKNASPFTKAEHPTLFVFCSIINPIIGLAFLGGGVRFFFRTISKNDIPPNPSIKRDA